MNDTTPKRMPPLPDELDVLTKMAKASGVQMRGVMGRPDGFGALVEDAGQTYWVTIERRGL